MGSRVYSTSSYNHSAAGAYFVCQTNRPNQKSPLLPRRCHVVQLWRPMAKLARSNGTIEAMGRAGERPQNPATIHGV